MKGSPFKLRSPLKQDLTMDSTIGDVGNKIKKEVKEFGKHVFMSAKSTTDQIINAPKDAFNAISNTSIRDAGEGVLNSLSSGTYKAGKDLYNKMKQRDGGHDDMMKTRKVNIGTGVGNYKSSKNQKQNNQAFMKGTTEALSERISSKRKDKTQSAGVDKSSKPSRLSIAINEINSRKKSAKLKKGRTQMQPASKIKPSGIVKNPKI